MESLLISTNLRGKYQYYVLLVVIFLPFTTFIISAGYPFLTYPPEVLCLPYQTSGKYYLCTLESYCRSQETFILHIKKSSLDNFTRRFSLFCERAFYAPLINSAFFLGAMIGVFFISAYPDIKGRLPILKYLMLLNIFAQINFLIVFNIEHLLFISLLTGICSYCNSILSLIICETMDKTMSALVMSARSASYGLVGIALGLFFLFVNKLKILLGINFFISVSLYFLVLAKFVESPRWLNSKNRMKDAIEALTHMAKTNNRKEEFDNCLKDNNEVLDLSNIKIQEIKNTLSLKQILLLKSQRGRIISLTYVWFFISVCFFGIFITLNKTRTNIFSHSVFTFLGEIVAEMISGILANCFGRVNVMTYLSYMGGISFIVSYFINENEYDLIKTAFLFISSFGFAGTMNLLYIYTNEIFPISIKSSTFGFMFLVSRAGGVAVPLFTKSKLYPIILGTISVSCGLMLRSREETIGKKLEDDVPESKREYSPLSTGNKVQIT